MRNISLVIMSLFVISTVVALNVTAHIFPRGGASINSSSIIVGTRTYVQKWINNTDVGSNFTRVVRNDYSSNYSRTSSLIVGSDVCVGASCGYVYKGNLVDGVLTCNPFFYETFQDCSSAIGSRCDAGPAICCGPQQCSYDANCYDSGTVRDLKAQGDGELEICYQGKWYDRNYLLNINDVVVQPSYLANDGITYTAGTFNISSVISSRVSLNVEIDDTSCEYSVDNGANWLAADYTGNLTYGTCYKNNLNGVDQTNILAKIRVNTTKDIRQESSTTNVTVDSSAPTLTANTVNNTLIANGTDIDYDMADASGVGIMSAIWSINGGATNRTFLNLTYEETNDTCGVYQECRNTPSDKVTHLYGVVQTNLNDRHFGSYSIISARDDDSLLCSGLGGESCYARIRFSNVPNDVYGLWFYTNGSSISYINVSIDNSTWIQSSKTGGWHWEYVSDISVSSNTLDIYVVGGLDLGATDSYFDQVLLEPKAAGVTGKDIKTGNFRKGYAWVDIWLSDFLDNSIQKRYRYDIGTLVKFNVTNLQREAYNFTKIFVLNQDGDYKNISQRKAYRMISQNNPLLQNIFSINNLADVYVEIPTTFGKAKLKINDANITNEQVKIRLIGTDNYTGFRPISGPMSDFFIVDPNGINFTTYKFNIPYNTTSVSPNSFLHCTNFDFANNNCTSWTVENVTSSSYLSASQAVDQKTTLRCVEFQNFGKFSPNTFSNYAPLGGNFQPLFFDDFEYKMESWTATNANAQLDSRDSFSGDSAAYVTGSGSSGAWFTKDVNYNSSLQPFLSFAYKVDSTSKFNFEAYSQSQSQWVTYNGTESYMNYSIPGFVADGKWRFAVINLDKDLDELFNTLPGTGHVITKLRFGTNSLVSTSDEFFIDDVLVANVAPQGRGDVQQFNDFEESYNLNEIFAEGATTSISNDAYVGLNSMSVTCSSLPCRIIKPTHQLVRDFPKIRFAYKLASTSKVAFQMAYKNYTTGSVSNVCFNISLGGILPDDCVSVNNIGAVADNTWRVAEINLLNYFDANNEYGVQDFKFRALESDDVFNIDTLEARRQTAGTCTNCVRTINHTSTTFSNGLSSYDVTTYDANGFNSTLKISVPKKSTILSAILYFDNYKNLTSVGTTQSIVLDAPMDVYFANNLIYLTDVAKRNVKVFYTNRTLKSSISTSSSTSSSEPTGVAVNSTGFIFVADKHPGQSKVRVFDAAGNAHASFGSAELNAPWGIDVDSSKIYVTDSGNNNLRVFSAADYSLLNTFTGFTKPRGVHVNSSGNIFVADECSVKILRTDGTLLKKIGGASANYCGKADYLFNFVSDVTTDSDGKIYVSDAGNHRIQVYDKEGTYRNTIGLGTCDSSSGGLCNPLGVNAANGGIVYITDAGNSRLQEFPPLTPSTFVADIGSDGLNKITNIGNIDITSEVQSFSDSCTCQGCTSVDYDCLIDVNLTSSGNVFVNDLALTFSGSVNDFTSEYVSDFEGSYSGWSSYAGATASSRVVQDISTSYFGRGSLRVNYTAGGTMFANFTPSQGLNYDTNKRPYLMFAYKVPSGSPFKLVLGDGTNNYVWNGSATTLAGETYVAEIPNFVADNTWRAAVISVDDNLDSKLGDIQHIINQIKVGNQTALGSTDAFWIDDFVVSTRPPAQCPYQQFKSEYSFSAASFDGGGGGETKPDLKIGDSDISVNPTSPNNEDAVTYTIAVNNIGDIAASNVNVTCEIDDVLVDFNASLTTLPVGSDTVTCSWTAQYGNHTFRANATTTDSEVSLTNNWGEYNITVADNVAPTIILYKPILDGYYSNPVELNYSVTDDSDFLLDCEYVLNSTYAFNSGSVSNNTFDQESMTTDGGSNSLYVTCVDDSNNRGNSSTVTFNSECTSGTQCGTGNSCVKDNTGFGLCTSCNSTYVFNACSNQTLGDYELSTWNSLCWNAGQGYACLPSIVVSDNANYPKVYQSGQDRTNSYVDINDTIGMKNYLATKISSLGISNLQMDCLLGGCSFDNASTYDLTTTPIETFNEQIGNYTLNKCGDWQVYSEIVTTPGQENFDYILNDTGKSAGASPSYANVTVDDIIVGGSSDVWLSGNSQNITASIDTNYCTGNPTRTYTIECFLDCDPIDADNSGGCSLNVGNSTSYGNYSVISGVTAGTSTVTITNMTPLDSHTIYCVANDDSFGTLDTDGYVLSQQFSTSVNNQVTVTTAPPISEGDDVTIQVNASDIFDKDNIRSIQLRVNTSAGNLFYDNLTTTVGGDCTTVDARNYTCEVTLKSIDAGIYGVFGKTENNAQFSAESSTQFSVEGLSCLLSVQNNTVQGRTKTARFNVIRIPSGDVEDFNIYFYNDSVLVGNTTSDVNGFAEFDFTTPAAGIHNYTVTCNKNELYDSSTSWIGTVGSSLTVTPNSKVFQLGTTSLNAYTFVLNNPSSSEQTYNVTLRSTDVIARFSENEQKSFDVTVPAQSKYIGHIDILPTKIGSETIEIWYVNVNSEADSIDSELDHVKFDAIVRSAYDVGAFSIEIASGMEILQIIILLMLTMAYLYIKL